VPPAEGVADRRAAVVLVPVPPVDGATVLRAGVVLVPGARVWLGTVWVWVTVTVAVALLAPDGGVVPPAFGRAGVVGAGVGVRVGVVGRVGR
jgi:hypothetical protein